MKAIKYITFILFCFLVFQFFVLAEPIYHTIKTNESITIERASNVREPLLEITFYSILVQTSLLITGQLINGIGVISNVSFIEYIKILLAFSTVRRTVKKDFSGLVYNAFDSKPIPFAVIRVMDAKLGNLIKTSVSDLEGRYGILLDQGSYVLNVQHQDYIFPVKTRNIKALQNDNASYFGEILHAKKDAVIDLNIPMAPRNNDEKFGLKRIMRFLGSSSLIKITQNFYFIYSLFLFSLLTLYENLNWFSLFLTLYYGLLTTLHIYAKFNALPKTWGRVVDYNKKSPIKDVFLRFYSKEGDLIDSKISDETGRFQVFLKDGEYYAMVQSNHYAIRIPSDIRDEGYKNMIKFKVDRGSINLIIELLPKSTRQVISS